jgi:hypothetical protein
MTRSGPAAPSPRRSVEQGHGGFGEVAAIADLPFIVRLDQDGAGQPEQGFGVGEDAGDVGAALDLLVEPLQRIGRPDFFQWPIGKR